MPAPGDQHQAWANPFEESKPRVSEWTAKEIATIASRLDKQLGPEYISSRAGPGGSRVHYLTAEKVIGLANEVFGFNGWSSSIQNIQVDFADENPQTQRVSIGLSVIVRVTLRDGTYHEDVGYGSIENAKGKAMAFEKAKKEGTTDALKRTLRNFGNVLGNCIYDQDYVKQVTKIKTQPNKKFDPDNLHRHSDFAKKEPAKDITMNMINNGMKTSALVTTTTASTSAAGGFKPEPMDSFDDFLGELDEADFCVPGEGHPDEIILPSAANPSHDKPAVPIESRQGQPAAGQPAKPVPGNNMNRPPQPQPYTPRQGQPPRPQNAPQAKDASMAPPQQPPPGEPVAFFSARSTLDPNQSSNNQNQQKQLFNPKAESPSIRKTPGIDHTSSKPVARNGQHVPPANSQASPSTQSGNTGGFTSLRQSIGSSQAKSGVMNPSLDQARRIGAPGGMGSPLANRNQYKPPTMKRTLPAEGNGTNGARSPLTDIPTNTTSTNDGDGLDAKRQKMA